METLSKSVIWKASLEMTAIHSMLAVLNDAYEDFSWTIWHQGVRAFDDGDPGAIREIETLRQDAVQKHVHDSEAQDLIRGASHRQLSQFVHLTRARVCSEFQLVTNFEWVADQERHRDEFRKSLRQRDFAAIRSIYAACQQQNPNARNLLAAVSNADIEVLVNAL